MTFTLKAQSLFFYGFKTFVKVQLINPIRSGGALKAPPPPPPIFCPHAFNFGATLLYVGDFSQKIV